MSLVNCSDGPPPLETPCTALERLCASVHCMADELERALQTLPADHPCYAPIHTAMISLFACSTEVGEWLDIQEDAPRG